MRLAGWCCCCCCCLRLYLQRLSVYRCVYQCACYYWRCRRYRCSAVVVSNTHQCDIVQMCCCVFFHHPKQNQITQFNWSILCVVSLAQFGWFCLYLFIYSFIWRLLLLQSLLIYFEIPNQLAVDVCVCVCCSCGRCLIFVVVNSIETLELSTELCVLTSFSALSGRMIFTTQILLFKITLWYVLTHSTSIFLSLSQTNRLQLHYWFSIFETRNKYFSTINDNDSFFLLLIFNWFGSQENGCFICVLFGCVLFILVFDYFLVLFIYSFFSFKVPVSCLACSFFICF